jgi:hypothetical protein
MNASNFFSCLLVVLLVSSVCPAYAVPFQKDAFSITLPDGWVEIPRDILDAYQKEAAKAVTNAGQVNYDFGFQLDSGENWLTYPYILIQVKNTGRIPENQLKEFESVSVQKEMNKMEDKVSSLLSDLQAGKTVYDQENKIIWMRIDVNAANVGPVVGIIAIVPTQTGAIQVNAYCTKADFPKYEPLFRSAVISTTPAPKLAYKMSGGDSAVNVVRRIDWGKVLQRGMLWSVIGGLIGGLSYVRKKKAGKGK